MRVQIHVNFNSSTSSNLQATTLPEVVNVSRADNVTTETSLGSKGFQLSPDREHIISTLDGSYGLFESEGYIGVLTRIISDETGAFTEYPVLNFTLDGYNLQKLYITFDRASNEYAEELKLTIDGVDRTIFNSKVSMYVDITDIISESSEAAHEVTVSLIRWSRPNASAKVTQITSEYADIFTGNSILDFTCSEHALAGQAYVQPGIVEQYAEISLYDRYNRIHEAATENIIFDDATSKIYSVGEVGRVLLGSYKVDAWDVQPADKNVKIQCSDPTSTFDKIYVKDLPVVDPRTLHDMLTELFAYIEKYPWKYLDTQTSNICKKLKTPNSWFKAGSLADQFRKVCAFGMLRIYWSNDTFIVMRCY